MSKVDWLLKVYSGSLRGRIFLILSFLLSHHSQDQRDNRHILSLASLLNKVPVECVQFVQNRLSPDLALPSPQQPKLICYSQD